MPIKVFTHAGREAIKVAVAMQKHYQMLGMTHMLLRTDVDVISSRGPSKMWGHARVIVTVPPLAGLEKQQKSEDSTNSTNSRNSNIYNIFSTS